LSLNSSFTEISEAGMKLLSLGQKTMD